MTGFLRESFSIANPAADWIGIAFRAHGHCRCSNALRIRHNRLIPVDGVARTALAKAIAEATAVDAAMSAGGITLALPDDNNRGLVAIVLPLNCGQRRKLCGPFAATTSIFVQDPMISPSYPGEAFAKLYGLTCSELRVLLAMSPGLCVKEAATMLGTSEAAAKTHLQHINAKTGTSKRTELMHLLMRSAPPVQAPPQPSSAALSASFRACP